MGTANGQTARSAPDCITLEAPPLALTPVQEEQQNIFLLLTMALLFDAWGIDRKSTTQITAYAAVAPDRHFADYMGHNIGALLVDRDANIICFALNRSVQFNSTLAHAEARAVQAAIAFANNRQPPSTTPSWTFSTLLQGDRLYGTLEPCAQCAGIMDLANIDRVVYAQDDPVQRRIANVLYNLHNEAGQPSAPLPVRAVFLPFWDMLAERYQQFVNSAEPGSRTGLTSFLQTVAAYRIYEFAAHAFETLEIKHAANSTILHNTRAFRSQWKYKIRDDLNGIVPTGPS